MIDLIREPRGETYAAMIDLAARRGGKASLVIQFSLPISPEAEAVRQRLEPYVLTKEMSDSWPGTKLHGDKALVTRFSLTPACASILKTSTNALYGWTLPQLPEDLCLLRADDTPWLVSIAHKRDGYVDVSDTELAELRREIPSIAACLRKRQ